ncbi:MAG: amidohydrolase family protein [Acidobacteria bacterium]|nr:amidohydrolase family protein [Acidobacteriota bacterium]
MNRRQFIQSSIAAAGAGIVSGADEPWGSPVLDIHLHLRRETGRCFDHMEGSGTRRAVLLTRVADMERTKAEVALHPDSLIWFAAADPTVPGALESLQNAVRSGARGIGEMKNHTEADSAAMKKVYDFAAEAKIPVLIHFQEVAHFAGEGDFNTGYRHFDQVLKAHPRTTFIGHADFFWAHISADVPMDTGYPPGPVKRGGLTDRWLADYPNFYGDLSANSGNNALHRDPEFSRQFLARHHSKLMFGSDCACRDGHGTGGTPLLERLKGKCTGRDTLGQLKQLTTPAHFRQITWDNGMKLLKLT